MCTSRETSRVRRRKHLRPDVVPTWSPRVPVRGTRCCGTSTAEICYSNPLPQRVYHYYTTARHEYWYWFSQTNAHPRRVLQRQFIFHYPRVPLFLLDSDARNRFCELIRVDHLVCVGITASSRTLPLMKPFRFTSARYNY